MIMKKLLVLLALIAIVTSVFTACAGSKCCLHKEKKCCSHKAEAEGKTVVAK